ncbi:MAG TPA: RNA 2',3'-cyclic phosphodiesterase [Kiritimatiellia bacterium]|jgi:2'-5' RNA ligase
MGETVRVFVALEISDEVRAGLAAVQEQLKAVGAQVSWVAPENIHLTVAFLGDVFESGLSVLSDRLDQAVDSIPPFSLSVQGLGRFGPARAPRVIWAGVRAPGELTRLYQGVADVLKGADIELEDRPFAPHVTIGRIKGPKNVAALTSQIASIKNASFGEVRVVRLLLMRSHLEQPRASYSELHASSLKGM